MISILKLIDKAISSTRLSDPLSTVTETYDEVNQSAIVIGTMTKICLNKWQNIYDHKKKDWLNFSFKDSFDDYVEPKKACPGTECTVYLSFKQHKNSYYFLSIEGWSDFLADSTSPYNCSNVFLLGLTSGFSTNSFAVHPWLSEPVEGEDGEKNVKLKVRHFVKVSTFGIEFPTNISPWMIMDNVDIKNPYFDEWKISAVRNLLLTIVNEVDKIDEELYVKISGKPPKNLLFTPSNAPIHIYPVLNEIVRWIYLAGDEIEIKHTLFTCELAREWPETVAYETGIVKKMNSAFESARLLYRAHLLSASKETLKTLGDLRKNLVEEVQKIVQQTKDIASTLWKDLALVLATIVFKYAMDNSRMAGNSHVYGYVFIALSIYILLSTFITLRINTKHIAIMNESREVWKSKLYSFLDEDEYNKIAGSALNKSFFEYKIIASIIKSIAFSMFFFLIMMGIDIIFGWGWLCDFIENTKPCISNYLYFLKLAIGG